MAEFATEEAVLCSVAYSCGARKIPGRAQAHLRSAIDVWTHRDQRLQPRGPSGSGKSALLRCINQPGRPDNGVIVVVGEIIGYRRAGDLLPELRGKELARQRSRTIRDNVMEG